MSKESNSYGITFFGLLTLLFIGLKLSETGPVAEWSWWIVLSPLWAPWVVIVVVAILIYAIRELWRGIR